MVRRSSSAPQECCWSSWSSKIAIFTSFIPFNHLLLLSFWKGKHCDVVPMLPILRIDSWWLREIFEGRLEAAIELHVKLVSSTFWLMGTASVGTSKNSTAANLSFSSKTKDQRFITWSSSSSQIFLLQLPQPNSNFFALVPAFGASGQAVTAYFNHVAQLLYHELKMPLKMVHKLMVKVLTPQPIEWSKVMLMERQFHESTVAAKRLKWQISRVKGLRQLPPVLPWLVKSRQCWAIFLYNKYDVIL